MGLGEVSAQTRRQGCDDVRRGKQGRDVHHRLHQDVIRQAQRGFVEQLLAGSWAFARRPFEDGLAQRAVGFDRQVFPQVRVAFACQDGQPVVEDHLRPVATGGDRLIGEGQVEGADSQSVFRLVATRGGDIQRDAGIQFGQAPAQPG
ncbi:hypothetical protein D9M69_586950 [compost metagenome]